MKLLRVIACGTVPFFLSGCATGAVKPSPTTDQVLAAQYRASAPHGAMSGPESDAVLKAYREDIARPAARTSEAMTEK
jgi:hypothetical protein